ncbi:MAG TPA: GAF domain-containing protein, partial [Gemmatimonadaceae bacterium]
MAPRTLPQLAHALHAAPSLDAALVALGEALLEIDRSASLALFQYNGRRGLLQDRLTPAGNRVVRESVDTRLDHLPPAALAAVGASTEFVDLAERSGEYLRLLGWSGVDEDAALAVRGLRVDGQLAAVLALAETRKFFGARTTERFAPAVALFDLAFGRFADRDARAEAVRTLEDVTQRVHGEYVRRLGDMERALDEARGVADRLPEARAAAQVAVERAEAQAAEEVRRARHRATQFEEQLGAAVGQLEQAHVELHRRSEALRQRTRTLYLLDRVLTLDAEARDARELVDGLLALVGDDMQAQRCSLLLRAPEPEVLYLAAARGLAPHVLQGTRVMLGEGVAGRVAASRQPLLVQDVEEAHSHPLLRDQYFTTGSFIS